KSGNNNGFETIISYLVETTGFELTHILNIVFGNISIKPGIRVKHLEFPESLLKKFKGPRFGRNGIRSLLNIPVRPLLSTSLKPLGLSAEALADLAYKFAIGGIDIIKDDHGLTDQSFAGFKERVSLCAKAIERANMETRESCIYVANVTAPFDKIIERARMAKRCGAGGLLISPGIVGLDTMRHLSADDNIGLPLFSHPALQGSFVINNQSGISHGVLFGQIGRLFGADAAIFPNIGGRFSFTIEECLDIVKGTTIKMAKNIKPIFPCPGGGMKLDQIPKMLQLYGHDVIFLIGGGLFSHGGDIVENCRYFRRMAEKLNDDNGL
ncbi:MAG: RuBisCO large subunit C-terminal-like domain-containing protein, partial [Nitrospirota bacterium]